ncbi:hypothetical protein KCP77_11080 [Salmonella enterica subsp. enterica]|nr:hypothetical protein KCP77_11080 [Salmonella enterica subsp. enterica]
MIEARWWVLGTTAIFCADAAVIATFFATPICQAPMRWYRLNKTPVIRWYRISIAH